jgi:hypothetical protein
MQGWETLEKRGLQRIGSGLAGKKNGLANVQW